jgi:hydrogenase nickel incorporation protein HypA/HybF
MHELSIAMSIIEVAQEESRRHGAARVSAVHLKLGPLAGVVREALESCYDLACVETPLAGSRLVVEEVPIRIECPSCGGPRPVVSPQEMACAVCGSPGSKIVQGRELEVVALELE